MLLSAALVSFALVLANGYWLPYLSRGGPDKEPRFHLDSRDRIGFYTIRLFTQTELVEAREELSEMRRVVVSRYNALGSSQTRAENSDERKQQMLVLRTRIEHHADEIAWMNWLRQLRTALALLPLFSVGLGFMIGRWATLTRPGLRRQLFTWSVSLPVVCGTGYALATANEYNRPFPRFDEFSGSAFAHVLVVPVVALMALICLWQVVRPRAQPGAEIV